MSAREAVVESALVVDVQPKYFFAFEDGVLLKSKAA